MRLRHKANAIPEMKESQKIIFDPEEHKGKWRKLFGNDRKIELEIGAGKGEFISQKAIINKDINYLALEMNTNAFVAACRKILENDLENVYGIVGKAENLLDYFDEGEISKLYLNFSTPWPKKRHNKRRLSHENFLKLYKEILADSAEIELKTDNKDFFEDTLLYFADFGLEILDINRNLDEKDSIVSEYEEKFRNKNMPIYFVKARFK